MISVSGHFLTPLNGENGRKLRSKKTDGPQGEAERAPCRVRDNGCFSVRFSDWKRRLRKHVV